jgi:hypothetical protein
MAARRTSEAAAKEKADRMKQYLEEKYERMKKDTEEIRNRRESLEDHMVRSISAPRAA